MPAQHRQSWLDRCSDKLSLLAGRSGSFRTKMPKIRKFWDQTFVGSWKLPPENSETLTYFFPIKGVGYIRQVPPDLDGGPKDTPMNLKAAHLPFLQPYISDVALDNSSTVIFAESHFKLNWHLTVQKSIYSGESGATASKISRAMGIDVEYTGCRNVVGCTRKGKIMNGYLSRTSTKSGGTYPIPLLGKNASTQRRESRPRNLPAGGFHQQHLWYTI